MKEVKVSEVINELKYDYEQILSVMSNKEYSPEEKEKLVKQIFMKITEKINEYMKK